MKAIFFLDVDTQKDLISPGGASSVPGADRLVPKFRRLFDFARKHEVFVLSSANARDPNDAEFQSSRPYCVVKTEGQCKIADTLFPRPLVLENKPADRNLLDAVKKSRQIIIEKQAADVFSNPITEKLLKALPPFAIVFGVPLETSVRLACLGLRRIGIKTALISDAVRALDPGCTEKTAAELRKSGVEWITLEMLLGLQA